MKCASFQKITKIFQNKEKVRSFEGEGGAIKGVKKGPFLEIFVIFWKLAHFMRNSVQDVIDKRPSNIYSQAIKAFPVINAPTRS